MHSASVCLFMGCLRRNLRLFSETASFQYSFTPGCDNLRLTPWYLLIFALFQDVGSGFLWEIIRYGSVKQRISSRWAQSKHLQTCP